MPLPPSVVHALRHDFTSVYYLSLYCAVFFPMLGEPDEVVHRYRGLTQMFDGGSLDQIARFKWALCCRGLAATQQVAGLPPASQSLRRWFHRWENFFGPVMAEKDRYRKQCNRAIEDDEPLPRWDDETCNGTFLYDILQATLESGRKGLVDPVLTENEMAYLTGRQNQRC